MRTDADREASKKHYAANAEKRKAATQAWREANPEKWAAYMRAYRQRKKAGSAKN